MGEGNEKNLNLSIFWNVEQIHYEIVLPLFGAAYIQESHSSVHLKF